LEGYCFVCGEKLGWGNRFDSTHLEIIPEGMTANEKVCYDCSEICTECGTKNISKAKFCNECGKSLVIQSKNS